MATITSEKENTFVTTQLGNTLGAWLGGEQPAGSSEPDGGWKWITSEPWVYTNWAAGEPNNTYGVPSEPDNFYETDFGKDATGQSEERLHFLWDGSHWNDLPNEPDVITPSFVVEWDVHGSR